MNKGTAFIKKYREFLHLQRQFKVIMKIKKDIKTMSTLKKKHDFEECY